MKRLAIGLVERLFFRDDMIEHFVLDLDSPQPVFDMLLGIRGQANDFIAGTPLNNVTISAGLQNVTDSEPPFVLGNFENGYDESLTTIKGRYWYVGLKKRF